MRRAHMVRKNKGQEVPEDFIFFDTETRPYEISSVETEHRFRLGVAVFWRNQRGRAKDTEQWINFSSREVFWDFVIKKALSKRRLVLIAHNVGYDMKVLKGFKTLRKRGFKLTKLISEQFVNIWKFKRKDRTLLFLDSMNFFNVSLKKLGKDIGLDKKEMPAFSKGKKEWFEYCKRDVEVIYYGIKEWLNMIKEHQLGCFSYTLAGQSFTAFRHRFNKHPIYIHNIEKAIALERESYHGGRTECFFIGKLPQRPYYCLDVNSMYPFVMKTNHYPIKIRAHLRHVQISALKRFLKKYCVIAKVKISTSIPLFPKVISKKLCFPIGQFETVLTSRELEVALENGSIKSVSEAVIYDKANIFREYVKFFYILRKKYRKEDNFSFSYISKLLLNSLYGKWGQRNENFEVVAENTNLPDGCWREWDMETKILHKYRCISGMLEESVGKVEAFNSFPGIASHVTADARLLLYDYIQKAGTKNVFYCDTDSLFVNQKGLDNLKPFFSNTVLGKLKLEYHSEDLEIKGLKDYKFGSKIKIKGIRASAKKLTLNRYEQWQWEGIRGALRNNRLDKMILIKIIKKLTHVYNKGLIKKSGHVVPYRLKEQ